jgi:LmbE family N-acetylglucosaminyl deacetylase
MMPDLGAILGVWAHPDDEGYLSAGLMADAVDNERRVVCVTATRGEAADPERWPPDELALIREDEIAKTLAILGVDDHRWLGYPDGGCADVDREEAIARIVAIIDEVRPDTVLTFGPDGNTGHPDHIAVSEWTEAAVARASCNPRLYFATNSAAWADRFEAAAIANGVMMGADTLPRTAVEELAIFVELDGELLDRKEQAMLAQASQVDVLRASVGEELYRELLREEAFRLP